MQITKPSSAVRLAKFIKTSTPHYTFYTTHVASLTPTLFLNAHYDQNPYQLVYSNNRKIDALIKSGNLISAHRLFDEMQICDVVTYNLIISGHGRHGNPTRALSLYSEMVSSSRGLIESSSTFSSVLSICSDSRFYREGIQVHCRVVKLGFGLNLFIGSSLVDLYMNMGDEVVALRMFDEMPDRNLGVWNLILRWFSDLGRLNELIGLYKMMRFEKVEPNGLSFCYLIRGFGKAGLLDVGKQLHCNVVKKGWVGSNVFVSNSLVDLYSNCKEFMDCMKSFEDILEVDVISWNSIVSAWVDYGDSVYALELFNKMQFWGKRPSVRSFVGFLNSCSETRNIEFGKQIHSYVLKMGFENGSVYVQSALINMYGKCGEIESSLSVYESLPDRVVECCNSLMSCFLQCGIVEDVVEMFGLMVDEGVGFDQVTLSITLKALSVSSFSNLTNCTLLHCCATKSGYECDIAVSCSLIDSYSKHGHVELSRRVFRNLDSPNTFCFTSMINGYARHGMGKESIRLLDTMIRNGFEPDEVTFLSLLTACNHSGLVEEAESVFDSMKSRLGNRLDRQHYSCMVDLLGRAGRLDEAEALLHEASGIADCVMWGSLLRNCRTHRNEALGRRVAKLVMELEPLDYSVYLQVSNFYAEIGEFDASMQVREIVMARKVVKEIGYSSIEVNG